MFEKMNYITLSGVKIPIKCDMIVLEKIQDEYGDITEFEDKLTGFEAKRGEDGEKVRNEEGFVVGRYGWPDIKALNNALVWMAEEGTEIERESGKTVPEIEEKKLLRMVDVGPFELKNILHKEFSRCFERKNQETPEKTGETETTE